METLNRIEEIKSKLPLYSAAIITGGSNRFYLTGFNSSAGTVFITKEKAYFLIDFRYFEKAEKTVKSCECILLENLKNQLQELCEKYKIKQVFIETENTTIKTYKRFEEIFSPQMLTKDDLIDKIIYGMRRIKTAQELEKIKQAQLLTDETFSYILPRISKGRTEREIMLDMEFFMRKNGSEGVSFDFIVVSGKNSSLPHGVPTDKKIESGDFITMDFGAVIEGYRSDMTRTVALGNISEKQRTVYNTVLKSQRLALDEIKAGKKCSDIDKTARDYIYNSGYTGCFGHGLGHSVGIDIHESPSFSPSCNEILKPGTVMTVEPGIYIENEFGVRIEDMIYVTQNGCINLTKSEKELIIL
ncbi:MAG: aminopeptidase P family protein [Clostridia bacterium]|nr:aminopeptidase P family protein [Clostridia bacterium]